jgi:hypothetical protein
MKLLLYFKFASMPRPLSTRTCVASHPNFNNVAGRGNFNGLGSLPSRIETLAGPVPIIESLGCSHSRPNVKSAIPPQVTREPVKI